VVGELCMIVDGCRVGSGRDNVGSAACIDPTDHYNSPWSLPRKNVMWKALSWM
jgi:hypothetical protein